ncbi:Hypothetical predicted protein, partial [Pelobates cultripes]
ETHNNGTSVDTTIMKGWVQRTICLFGNANSALVSEGDTDVPMKIDLQLTHLANKESGPSAEGFGDYFIKEIGKYIFSLLDKAQSTIKINFKPKSLDIKEGTTSQPILSIWIIFKRPLTHRQIQITN